MDAAGQGASDANYPRCRVPRPALLSEAAPELRPSRPALPRPQPARPPTGPSCSGWPHGSPSAPSARRDGDNQGERSSLLLEGEEQPCAPRFGSFPDLGPPGNEYPSIQGMVEGHLTMWQSPAARGTSVPLLPLPLRLCSPQGPSSLAQRVKGCPSWDSRFGAILAEGLAEPPSSAGAVHGCVTARGCPALCGSCGIPGAAHPHLRP